MNSSRPKKSLGQHFLTSTRYCRRIADYADLCESDLVVEIGPGRGHLTEHLLEQAGKVLAIELDSELVQFLHTRFDSQISSGTLELIETDVLQVDWAMLLSHSGSAKLVANLPYNISTRILTKMSEAKDRFHSLSFMVQREVADRILAQPGEKDYGYFTLAMEYHYDRVRGFAVPPGAFSPPPRVFSYVMKLIPRREGFEVAPARFLEIARQAFVWRRKTLWNNLKRNQKNLEALARAFRQCSIPLRARPQEVSLDQYLCLARML